MDIDESGHTTARKLYQWLELNQANYSHWIKRNITENLYAEEGKDYSLLRTSENEGRGNYAQDYLIFVSFAKKLAMSSRSPKGEETREYFIKVEDALVKVTQKPMDQKPKTQAEIMLWSVQKLVEQEKRLVEVENRQDDFSADLAEVKADHQGDMMAFMNGQDSLAEEIQLVKNALYVRDSGFLPMTVVAWKNANGIYLKQAEDSKLGKICTRLSRERGYKISTVPVPGSVYGTVNAYEPFVIRRAYKEFCKREGRECEL